MSMIRNEIKYSEGKLSMHPPWESKQILLNGFLKRKVFIFYIPVSIPDFFSREWSFDWRGEKRGGEDKRREERGRREGR